MFRSVVLVCAIAGCVAPDELQTSTVEEHLCGGWLCGSNSPTIIGIGEFYDLNLKGEENNQHLVLAGFVQNGVVWTPHVVGGKFTASRRVVFNGVPVTFTIGGAQLIGGRLWMAQTTTGRVFQIGFTDVVPVHSWARLSSGAAPLLEAYVLNYYELLNGNWGDPHTLCSNPPSRENPDVLGMDTFATLFFEGDRIDATSKRDTAVDNSWFNLGCAGHTLAKLALTGHTEAAKTAATFTTTLDERTTMLKMLAADYCGTGDSFTVTGQQLRWADDHGTMRYNEPGLPVINTTNAVLEARWTPHGAHCLLKTRVDVNPTFLAKQTFGDPPGSTPNVHDMVLAKCPQLPVCTDTDFSLDGFHLTTITPIP